MRPASDNVTSRRDLTALWSGVALSVFFTVFMWATGQRLLSVPLLPDQGASWYYWKLPEPTFWTRATAWGLYALHQVGMWALIVVAQRRLKGFRPGLDRLNLAALGLNGAFIALHWVQSQLWYDGLAQDVSIWSSQGSVIVMLVAILLMENQRRRLFFGRRAPISQEIVRLVRTYHGYVFSWAAIYTFWYHPMVPTAAHLPGFFYMFLLLLQGSLFFTRAHVNRWWMVTLDVFVLVHGTIVALTQGNGMWPMFAFGFGGIFIVTQMHGLGLALWQKWALAALYVAAALAVYSGRGWVQLNEIIRIPVIEYVMVFVMAGLVWLLARLGLRPRAKAAAARSETAAQA